MRAGTAGTPDRQGDTNVSRPVRGRLTPIVPVMTATRDPGPPPHDGPDAGSATVLDGMTALFLARQRQHRAREALGERPAGSSSRHAAWPHPVDCQCASCVYGRRPAP